MRLDEAGLDDYTDRFSWSAWRYETRDVDDDSPVYDVDSDDDAFERYSNRLAPPDGFGAGWHQWLDDRHAEGRRVYRVCVLSRPPSLYKRFEFEFCYLPNLDHHEAIHILDLTEQPRPAEVVDDELWVMDLARVAVLTYDDRGRFAHADTAEGDDAAPYARAVSAAWDAGEPFRQWWDRHPEYHRAAWLGEAAGRA